MKVIKIIYVRQNNKWVVDEKFMDNFFIDGNQLFCNVNKDCVYDNEKCKSIDKENNDDSRLEIY